MQSCMASISHRARLHRRHDGRRLATAQQVQCTELTTRALPPSTSTLLPSTMNGKESASGGFACAARTARWRSCQTLGRQTLSSTAYAAAVCMPGLSSTWSPVGTPSAAPESGTRRASCPGLQSSWHCSHHTPARSNPRRGRTQRPGFESVPAGRSSGWPR